MDEKLFAVDRRDESSQMRHFPGGATRDSDARKLDFDAIFEPRVLEAFAHYMNLCRETPEGLREADNWKKGFPDTVLIKSMWRHFFALWKFHHCMPTPGEHPLAAACGVLFNLQAYISNMLKQDPSLVDSMHVSIALARRGSPAKGTNDARPDAED